MASFIIKYFLLLWTTACLISNLDAQDFVVLNNAEGTPGGERFNSEIGLDAARQILSNSTTFIQSIFNYSNPATPQKQVSNITFSVDTNITFIVAAYTIRNEVHLSDKYVESYKSGDLATEIKGVLFHEMTHVWQWAVNAPSGLIEGVADFVRLKAGLAPSHWKKPGEGYRWDQGYDVSAYFLDFCNDLNSSFVSQLNAKLATGWNESYFSDLLGKRVDQLWDDYKAKYNSSQLIENVPYL